MSRDTAGHEAAHCVAAVALGMDVSSVEVYEGGGGLAKVDISGRSAMDVAVVAAAGYEYARLRLERGGDSNYADELDGAGHDLEVMRRHLPGDDDAARERRGEAMDRARRIVVEKWDDIQRLADQLYDRRRLDGLEVARGLGVAPSPPERSTAPPERSSAGRSQKPPWLVATRSFEVGGHAVVAGDRCLPGSPAFLSKPDAWRAMRASDRPRIETRVGPPMEVRG